jgi:hypothetical protein
VIGAIVAADFTALTVVQVAKLQLLLSQSAIDATNFSDVTSSIPSGRAGLPASARGWSSTVPELSNRIAGFNIHVGALVSEGGERVPRALLPCSWCQRRFPSEQQRGEPGTVFGGQCQQYSGEAAERVRLLGFRFTGASSGASGLLA